MRIGRLYSCLASERAVPKKSLRRLLKKFSFRERKAGNQPAAGGKRIGFSSGLIFLVAPVLHSCLSCVALAALALAEFVGAHRPALQLLSLRAGSPKETLATLGGEIFFPGAHSLVISNQLAFEQENNHG